MPLATTPDKRGLKRICMSCSTRFYDFNKRPIICPNCSAEFTGDIKIKGRRTRVANDEEELVTKLPADEAETEVVKDDEADAEAEDDETVSLDDVEEDDGDESDEDELDADLDLDEDDIDTDDLDDDDLDEDDDEDDGDDDEDDEEEDK